MSRDRLRFRDVSRRWLAGFSLAALAGMAGIAVVVASTTTPAPARSAVAAVVYRWKEVTPHGAFPEGYCRADLTRRMLDRAPDLTRLIDRLVRRGLVQRLRSEKDGRQSVARITPRGRHLLSLMNPKVRAVEKSFSNRLTEAEALELSRLCEKIYGSEEDEQQ